MRTLIDLLIGISIIGCGPAPQGSSPQLLIDQTSPKDVAAHIQAQAFARVAAANKMTVADVEAKIAAGDAAMKKALDEAMDVERQSIVKWQSAMTYKFVGGLDEFMNERDAGGTTDQ